MKISFINKTILNFFKSKREKNKLKLINDRYFNFSNKFFNTSNNSYEDKIFQAPLSKNLASIYDNTVFIGNKNKLLENYMSIIIACINLNRPFNFFNKELFLPPEFIEQINILAIKKKYSYKIVVDNYLPSFIKNSDFFDSSNSYIFNLNNSGPSDLVCLLYDCDNIVDVFFKKICKESEQHLNRYNFIEQRAIIWDNIDNWLYKDFINIVRGFRKLGVQMFYYLDENKLSFNEENNLFDFPLRIHLCDVVDNYKAVEVGNILDLTPNIAFLCEDEKNISYRLFLESFKKTYNATDCKTVLTLPENYNYVVARRGCYAIYKIQNLNMNGDHI